MEPLHPHVMNHWYGIYTSAWNHCLRMAIIHVHMSGWTAGSQNLQPEQFIRIIHYSYVNHTAHWSTHEASNVTAEAIVILCICKVQKVGQKVQV